MHNLKRGTLSRRFIPFIILSIILLLLRGLPAVQAAGTTISISNVRVRSVSCDPSGVSVDFAITIDVPEPGAYADMYYRVSAPGHLIEEAPSSLGFVGPGPVTRVEPAWNLGTTNYWVSLTAHTPITVTYYDDTGAASASFSVDCTSGAVIGAKGGVLFFSPGDSRVDARPGERLTVWCNQSDQIVVYGIAGDRPASQSGFLLTIFSYKEVLAAGPQGLTHDLGDDGSVSISIIKGWFWIAWNGGKYHATGNDTFVKNFSADAWCTWGK